MKSCTAAGAGVEAGLPWHARASPTLVTPAHHAKRQCGREVLRCFSKLQQLKPDTA